MSKNTEYSLALDLDGVLADFDARVQEITDGRWGNDPEFSKGRLWKAIKEYNDTVQPFFATLPKMPGADELVKFAVDNFENVAFLTATGSTPKDAPEQKKQWAKTNYPEIPICITVGASTQKAIYANPRAILVDDREKSIDPWRRAGGFGILFKNNAQAISELKKVLN
jgi:5'(3')-deoxyribonucleotidase